MAEISPVLADLLSFITTISASQELFDISLDLLHFIGERARGCFVPVHHNSGEYVDPITPVAAHDRQSYLSPIHEVMDTGAYFPGRPYHSIMRDLHLSNDSSVCNKDYKKKGRLGAGTLLFWCGEHRKCLGFYIMSSAESPKIVYTILATRFVKQPRVIIYDNGCNLSDYILNRSPLPFIDTYILSDGFHWKNHTNCGPSFNSKLYPALNGKFN